MQSCTECQACCHHLVIRARRGRDLEREPRILLLAHHEGNGVYRLAPTQRKDASWNYHCPFLQGWGCSVYPTRPDSCRIFKRRSQQCAAARKRAGKEPL